MIYKSTKSNNSSKIKNILKKIIQGRIVIINKMINKLLKQAKSQANGKWTISCKEALKRLQNKDSIFLDVRAPETY